MSHFPENLHTDRVPFQLPIVALVPDHVRVLAAVEYCVCALLALVSAETHCIQGDSNWTICAILPYWAVEITHLRSWTETILTLAPNCSKRSQRSWSLTRGLTPDIYLFHNDFGHMSDKRTMYVFSVSRSLRTLTADLSEVCDSPLRYEGLV